MKTKIISKLLVILGLLVVLGSAITQVHGQGVVIIQSTGDVARGETGSFVLNMNPPPVQASGMRVNFSISGTAIPGVDYVPLFSPVLVSRVECQFNPAPLNGPPIGLAVIRVKTLPDPRASVIRQACSVVLTLEPGLGYAIDQPSSAKLMINPLSSVVDRP